MGVLGQIIPQLVMSIHWRHGDAKFYEEIVQNPKAIRRTVVSLRNK